MPQIKEKKESAMPQSSSIKRSDNAIEQSSRYSIGPVLACIDLGTNSFHMIVCRAIPDRDHFEIMFRSKEAVPFFRRALTNHFIDDSAMRAAVRIVKDMTRMARDKGATTIVAVATSAVRESKNGEDFLGRIRNDLNIDADMLSGTEEARLIYLGVLSSMPELKGKFAIIDIGGGSTEIVVADQTKPAFLQSYKLGAARLSQKFLIKDSVNQERIQQVHEEVASVLQPAAVKIEACGGYTKLIGTSGTIQALAKIDRELSGSSQTDLHGWKLSLERLKPIISYLEDCALRREKIKYVNSDRAQTILAGSIVLVEAMKSLSANEITICTAALREGVAVDRFLRTGWLKERFAVHQDPRSISLNNLLQKYRADLKHAEQVAYFAHEIFWQTRQFLHHYSHEVANLLWAAAMLHDLGMFINRSGHHKHSYYLINQEELLGFSREEVQIIASIARYHRGSAPKETHDAYVSLPTPERKLVTDMAAILRLAEALDRSHRQIISELKIKDKEGIDLQERQQQNKKITSLIFAANIAPGQDGKAEAWAFKEKKALFESQFKKTIVLELNKGNAKG